MDYGHMQLSCLGNGVRCRLDNLVFDERDHSKVLAVLDWELSTIGDPLADLAYACICYHLPPVRVPALLGCRFSGARAATLATR